jgi:glycerol-3-phosphate acyltransferase PlsY
MCYWVYHYHLEDISMQLFLAIGVLLLSYLAGSIPFGLIIVRLKSGKDVRQVESGRTGGTNVMRAAGLLAGMSTAVLDFLKGAVGVWLARWLLPDMPLLHALAPIASVLGHNYSILLAERDEQGRLRLRGGAGGATAAGGAFGLWAPSLLIILPVGLVFLFGIGYASLATMSIGITAALIFIIRWLNGASPWEYILYGLLVEVILIWALRPNIRRLINGTERVVGWRARRHQPAASIPSNHSSSSSSS